MSESTKRGSRLIKLGKLANSQKFDALEEAWLDAIAAQDVAITDLISIAGQVGRLGAKEKAESLVAVLLSYLEEKSSSRDALDATRQAAEEFKTNSALRQEIVRLYLAVHSDHADLPSLLNLLCAETAPLDEAVRSVDHYLLLRPGVFILDRRHLVPGLIESVDGQSGAIVARFELRHETYDPASAMQLDVLPDDHFAAMLLYEPEKLGAIAQDDPVAFVQIALKSEKDGRLAYRKLKDAVIVLLGESNWSGWWKQAKSVLKRSSVVALSGGSQPTIRLLRERKSYESRLRTEFDRLSDSRKRLELVLSFLNETAGKLDETNQEAVDLFSHFGSSAAKMAVAALTENPAVALAGLAVHAEVARLGVAVPTPNPKAAAHVLGKIADSSELAVELSESLLTRSLAYVRDVVPERWPQVWAGVMKRASRRTCDSVARELIEAGQLEPLETILGTVVARPTSSPECFCWLWRAYHVGNLAPRLTGFESLSAAAMLTGLLNLADASGRLAAVTQDDRQHKNLEMVQQAMNLEKGMPVRAIFAAADPRSAAEFKRLMQNNAGLAARGRGQMLGLLRAEHAELFIEDNRPWEEDDVIFTTKVGLSRRQDEFDEIVKIAMPAVAKQIGEAAAFGDLSENAEYTAALEKRDQLASRAANMESELQVAKVISREMADSPHVNIGTRVRARDCDKDEEVTYTFLGPWDGDPEHGILTYNAPVSLAFMGKKIGEEVVYGEGADQRRWEVLAIEPAV